MSVNPLLCPGMADADTHPAKIRTAVLVDRAQPVVPGQPAAVAPADAVAACSGAAIDPDDVASAKSSAGGTAVLVFDFSRADQYTRGCTRTFCQRRRIYLGWALRQASGVRDGKVHADSAELGYQSTDRRSAVGAEEPARGEDAAAGDELRALLEYGAPD